MSNLSDIYLDLREEQANKFAGAFLLPARAFARDMHAPTLGSFYRLKPKWKVAIGAMIKRAEHLGFLSDSEVKRMWIALARKGQFAWFRTYGDAKRELSKLSTTKDHLFLLVSKTKEVTS